jgi:hypothetical protein
VLEHHLAAFEGRRTQTRSWPHDVQPHHQSIPATTVLDTLVESAVRLCEADLAAITRQKGNVYRHPSIFSHGLD